MKVIDTLKRTIKFSNVEILDGELMDEEGSLVDQIISKLPKEVETFEIQLTAALPINVDEASDSEDKYSDEE